MATVALRQSDDFARNRDGPRGPKAGEYPCVLCGLACPNPKFLVRLAAGGALLFSPDEFDGIDPAGDLGSYPIGEACLRKQPALRPFAFEA